jgi:hypothetical protein
MGPGAIRSPMSRSNRRQIVGNLDRFTQESFCRSPTSSVVSL